MIYTEGNILSVLVFFLWIPVALWGAYRWPPAKAASLLLLLPLMFLPERVAFNLPGLPEFGKAEVAVFWLLIGVLLFHRHRLDAVRLSKGHKIAILLLFGGSIVTTLLNMQPIMTGSRYLVGQTPLDVVGAGIGALLNYALPFVLGAAMFRDPKELKVLFVILATATVGYGVLQLVEVALSPQLNTWVYGFFQHSWIQMKRGGGFRPIVFMSHGLAVAMFTMVGLTATAALLKIDRNVMGVRPVWALLFLSVVVVLNKSAAALVYGLVAVTLVLFTKPKTQFRFATFVAIFVLLYPILRAADWVPVERLKQVAEALFSSERALSLNTRFVNEALLLERAWERPFFGWGGYGRSFLYNPNSGRLMTIADGEWVVTMGKYGLAGFLGKFLLLVLPIWGAARARRLPRRSDQAVLAALALIVAFSALDLIPNSAAHYLPFLFAGALVGCTINLGRERRPRERGVFSRMFEAIVDLITRRPRSPGR